MKKWKVSCLLAAMIAAAAMPGNGMTGCAAESGNGDVSEAEADVLLSDENEIVNETESTVYEVEVTVTYQQTTARSILDMINELRTGDDAWYWDSDDETVITCDDLSELTYDYELEAIAMQRAAELALFYSHTRPNGSSCFTVLTENGYTYYYAGENIAAGYTSASAVFTGWAEEDEPYSGQGHRRNMLSSKFTSVGIACVYCNGYYYWVQEFAYPRTSSTTSATEANDSATTVTVNVISDYISDISSITADPEEYELLSGNSEAIPDVTAKITLLSSDGDSYTWPKGQYRSMTVPCTWSSSDESIASISDDQITAGTAGTATLSTSALGETLEVPVTVTYDLTLASVAFDEDTVTYDGTEQEPALTVTYDSTVLTEGTDYTLTYSDNVNAGTATVVVEGIGDYTGEIEETFTIEQADISDADITLEAIEYTYDGMEKEPAVTAVTVANESAETGSVTLVSGTDYSDVVYQDNLDAGTATVSVTGTGNYQGTATAEFTINPADLSAAEISLSETSYTYDGTAKEPEVTAVYNSMTLVSGTDYTGLTYADNTDASANTEAGAASVTITGTGNYTGTATATFTIAQADLSAGTLTLEAEEYTYDGTAQEPAVTAVKYDTLTLTAGTDFSDAVYADNVNAGTATASVTGAGNFTGTLTAEFTIDPASFSNAEVILSESEFTYDGTEKKPTVTVEMLLGDSEEASESTVLTEDTDYTLTRETAVDAGTAAVTVTGMGNYTGTASATITISPADLSEAEITLSEDSYTYDGTAKEPEVTAVYNSMTLVSGTDYTDITYTDNTNASENTEAGTASVSITGTGNYTGTVTVTFTIEQADLSKGTLTLEAEEYDYDGTAKKPAVTAVVYNSVELTAGTDYSEAVYTDNFNAGTATVTVNGAGNYTGTLTTEFTINPIDITDAVITLSESEYTYDGTAKEPAVTAVEYDSMALAEEMEYTNITYSDNTNAGTATVTVDGTGNYTGTATAAFTIDPVDLSNVTLTLSQETYSYNGTEREPAVTLEIVLGDAEESTTLAEDTDYTVEYTDNTIPGTAVVVASGAGNYTGELETEFTITALGLSEATIMISPGSTYDGTEQKPSVTVEADDAALTEGTDYTLEYADNINAGTEASVTVTGIGYCEGEVTQSFTIDKATQTITVTFDTDAIQVGETLSITVEGIGDISFTIEDSAVASIKVTDGTCTVTGASAGDAVITINAAGNDNYNEAETTVTITVEEAEEETEESETEESETEESGSSGESGSSEESGTTEERGSSEESGTTGESGSSEESGTTGESGSSGESGSTGDSSTVEGGTTGSTSGSSGTGDVTESDTSVTVKATKLKSVKNTASKKITVKWKKKSGVTGYQIQYSTSKKFKKAVKTVNVKGAKKTKKVISKLKKGKTYYVRIHTYKVVNGKTYYSTWSAKKKVKIKK
ncbi:MAG: CAP domain-containing protein [Lachnospiraceae bacterium]|nr:CAP domain-containing protein [Lachnospiraceae bacterium]